MKIMSLNVGKFFPLGLLEGSKIKEIIACIQTFLFSDISGVVFLQEVPEDFIDELEKILNGGDKAIFDIIRPEPDPPRQVNGYTLAIKNRKGDWKPVKVGFKEYKKDIEENTSDDEFTDRYKKNGEKYEWFYENIFIEIKSNTLDLQILGVHAPWTKGQKEPPKTSNTVFWKALEGYAKTKKEANSRFIIVGDMNADTIKESLYHDYMNRIKDSGYTLAIVELEEKEKKKIVTHVTKSGTNDGRIDHVIASPELQGKVTAHVIPMEILKLSDHAVIIADVNI